MTTEETFEDPSLSVGHKLTLVFFKTFTGFKLDATHTTCILQDGSISMLLSVHYVVMLATTCTRKHMSAVETLKSILCLLVGEAKNVFLEVNLLDKNLTTLVTLKHLWDRDMPLLVASIFSMPLAASIVAACRVLFCGVRGVCFTPVVRCSGRWERTWPTSKNVATLTAIARLPICWSSWLVCCLK